MFQKNTIETRRVSKILGRLVHDVFLICKTEGQDPELVDSAYSAVRRIDLAAFNHRAGRAYSPRHKGP